LDVCLADDATIRSSVGAGLLWNSPLGPLRLDYAYVLTKESYDKTQAIRFGASTKF
jgi:outer membrane protein insertion porin family